MKKHVIFGDPSGLQAIYEALQGSALFSPSAVIYSANRPEAKQMAMSIAREYGAQVIEQPLRKSDTFLPFLQLLKEIQPEIGLCVSYDLILPQLVLDIFRDGVFNVHGALLPKYRGANVLNWVLINGEKETGATLHKMEANVDSGDIAVQHKVPIDFCDTAVTLREKLAHETIKILEHNWTRLMEGDLPLIKQDDSLATVVHRRKPEDGFFEWSWPAEQIYNLIRALVKPWPGAWYRKGEEKIIIDEFMTFEQVQKRKSIEEVKK